MNNFKTALIGAVAVGTALLGAAPAQADTAQDPGFWTRQPSMASAATTAAAICSTWIEALKLQETT